VSAAEAEAGELTLKHLGVDTQREHVIYMNGDSPVCKSEGFEAQARIRVEHRNGTILASLQIFRNDLLGVNEVSLSEDAWRELKAQEGDTVKISHPEPVSSFGHVRSKIYGNELGAEGFHEILRDIVRNRYSDIQLSSFVTAFAGQNMTYDEMYHLTDAMIDTGEQLEWDHAIVGDKHSLGGLPGNRTTPIVVAIAAREGVVIPKTSSRAITSPAGTADTMETITRVNLDLDEMKEVVEQENGCFVWGGTAELSPADDMLIQVERSLDLDSEGQMIASILSKKAAAGSSHVVIDMPLGPTAKVRSEEQAQDLRESFRSVADKIGMTLDIVPGNGKQPIGRGIGPALEARDILQVLRQDDERPKDLEKRSIELAGALLELTETVEKGVGTKRARKVLESGAAYEKFKSICHAQGRLDEPPSSPYQHDVTADVSGRIESVDNRKLARSAKLAGAPNDPSAGVDYLIRLGQKVEEGDTLFQLHAETCGELDYALDYVNNNSDIFEIDEADSES
jgi:thymidine phosphorylase